MLQLLNYIFRGLGVICFLLTCYLWFYTSNFQFFLIAKRFTIIFFSLSLLLWITSIVLSRIQKEEEE